VHGWQWARKGVAPAFSMVNLKQNMRVLHEQIDSFVTVLDHFASNGTVFDVSEWSMRFTMDFLCASMFHIEGGSMFVEDTNRGSSQTDGTSNKQVDEEALSLRLLRLFKLATIELFSKRLGNPFRQYLFWDREKRQALAAMDEIMKIALDILKGYRDTHSKEEIKEDIGIVGHLVRTPYPSEKARAADVVTFMLAGHDTTGYTVAWILTELSRNPDVQRKLQKELDQQNPKRLPWTIEMLRDTPYQDCVIKEAMRLWPVAAMGPTAREIDRDIPVGGGKVIPKGSFVSMNLFATFRSGIQDPDSFIPERWEKPSNPDAGRLEKMHIPFGAGKRVCVGQNLAYLELRMVVATMLQRFDFEQIGVETTDFHLTLKPAGSKLKASVRGKTK